MTRACMIRPLNQETSWMTRHICTPAHFPRLSEVNLYTLLSLWMEIFPRKQPEGSRRDPVISLRSRPFGAAPRRNGRLLHGLCVGRSVGRAWRWCGPGRWWVSTARGPSSTRAKRPFFSTAELWQAVSCISPGGPAPPASR